MWEPLSPVFVYGAQPSYLQPVLTPHSSCFKSLLLIFLFSPATVAAWLDGFLVLSVFLWIICACVCVLFLLRKIMSASELRGKCYLPHENVFHRNYFPLPGAKQSTEISNLHCYLHNWLCWDAKSLMLVRQSGNTHIHTSHKHVLS